MTWKEDDDNIDDGRLFLFIHNAFIKKIGIFMTYFSLTYFSNNIQKSCPKCSYTHMLSRDYSDYLRQ